MPRLGLAVNEDFASHRNASTPDKFGRRVRYVNGLQVREEKTDAGLYSLFIVKLALWLSVIAVMGMSVALWRLFSFPH